MVAKKLEGLDIKVEDESLGTNKSLIKTQLFELEKKQKTILNLMSNETKERLEKISEVIIKNVGKYFKNLS